MSVIQITDLNDPQLDIYARLSEGQLLHYYEPDLGIFIAESPKVIQTAFEQGYEPISFLVEDRHIKTQAKDIILQYCLVKAAAIHYTEDLYALVWELFFRYHGHFLGMIHGQRMECIV